MRRRDWAELPHKDLKNIQWELRKFNWQKLELVQHGNFVTERWRDLRYSIHKDKERELEFISILINKSISHDGVQWLIRD